MSSFKLEILLIGATGVEKTKLIQPFVKKRFQANYGLTVGVNILTKDVEFEPGYMATLSIWDIRDQQRFEFIRSTFYKGKAGAILIFDLTREQTYYEVRKRLTEIRQVAGENISFVFIGNNAHLPEVVEEVRSEARVFAENEGTIYIETSPETGENVDEAFTELTRRIIDAKSKIFDDKKPSMLKSKEEKIREDSEARSLILLKYLLEKKEFALFFKFFTDLPEPMKKEFLTQNFPKYIEKLKELKEEAYKKIKEILESSHKIYRDSKLFYESQEISRLNINTNKNEVGK